MTTDLVAVGTADDIASLPPVDRAQMVTHALVESKAWLAVATKGTDPTPIAEFKAWAATVAEMTRQKGLASEIQADALEMLRRAERGIGLAVRNGQEAGEIAKPGDIGGAGSPGCRGSLPGSGSRRSGAEHLASPRSFFGNTAEMNESYAMTDGVTDEQYEDVLTEARDEGNLSRANVVRKVKAAKPQTRDDRADIIEELAAKGSASAQIARHLGIGEEAVRRIARDYGIDIPADRVLRGTHRIDTLRVVRETVIALEGHAMTVDLVSSDALAEADPREVEQWTASLDQSIRALRSLRTKIEKAVQ
jgi:hypothetical protein